MIQHAYSEEQGSGHQFWRFEMTKGSALSKLASSFLLRAPWPHSLGSIYMQSCRGCMQMRQCFKRSPSCVMAGNWQLLSGAAYNWIFRMAIKSGLCKMDCRMVK